MHIFRKEADFEAFERIMVEAHARQPIRIESMEFRFELNAKLHGFHGFHGFHAAIDPARNLPAKQAHARPHFILRSMRWIRAIAPADPREHLLSVQPASLVQPGDLGSHES
jgi:hypothetical protein